MACDSAQRSWCGRVTEAECCSELKVAKKNVEDAPAAGTIQESFMEEV